MPIPLFNHIWKKISGVIQSQRNLSKQELEKILDFSHIERYESKIRIVKGKIEYIGKELSDEEKKERSLRQSMLDNPKFKCYYALSGGAVHDKECEEIQSIPMGEFCASEKLPADRKLCSKCKRKLLLRIACAPNTKQIPICERLLTRGKVQTGNLYRYVVEVGMKFHATTLDELTIICREDTWKVKYLQGVMQLWHNNYIKVNDTERYITDGFHNQGVESKGVDFLLQYIQGYTWEKHLQGQLQRSIRIEEEAQPTNNNVLMRIICWVTRHIHRGEERK